MSGNNIGLDRMQLEKAFDFADPPEDSAIPNNIYNCILHSCEYFTTDEFNSNFHSLTSHFSTLSLNVRSLPGHWIEFEQFVNSLNKDHFKFSVIAVQEIWNKPPGVVYNLEGYKPLEFRIRDPSGMSSNAGGGVGFWIDKDLQYEVIHPLSVFEPHFF